MLTSSTERARLEALADGAMMQLDLIETDGVLAAGPRLLDPGRAAPCGGIAFLQYTSGSTGVPKGVMVTHHNLAHHARLVDRVALGNERGPIFSWLPLYHDLGLIGCVIQSAIWGEPFMFMAPASFLQRPLSWLQIISDHSILRSGGPNFAYDLCVQAYERRPMSGLDLSSWRFAFSGAEPIRPATFRRFVECFEAHGFDPGAFTPGYGLAEATLHVTGSRRTDGAADLALDPEALERGIVTPSDSEKARSFMSCGRIPVGIHLEIVDPATLAKVDEGCVGEIWIAGETVTQGYWDNPSLTRETFGVRLEGSEASFLRSGDLGFLRDGHLFVVGRMKDVIIIEGRNLYPGDIEERAQEVAGRLRRDHIVAFGVHSDTESLAIVGEVTREAQRDDDLRAELGDIARAIITLIGIAPRFIGVVRPGRLPKTSSGKLKRKETQRMFLSNELEYLETWPGPGREEHHG